MAVSPSHRRLVGSKGSRGCRLCDEQACPVVGMMRSAVLEIGLIRGARKHHPSLTDRDPHDALRPEEATPEPERWSRNSSSICSSGASGTPSEVAQMALFLASDDSRFLHRQALRIIGGGMSAGWPANRATDGTGEQWHGKGIHAGRFSAQVQNRTQHEHKLTLRSTGMRSAEMLCWREFWMKGARVILLQAPAGHSKTTLLQQLQAGYNGESQGTPRAGFSDRQVGQRRSAFLCHLRAMVSDMRRKWTGLNCEPAVGADGIPIRLACRSAPGDRQAGALFLDDLHAVGTRSTLSVIRSSGNA